MNCSQCGKATWSGCGAHVEQVLAGVPQAKRCTCALVAGPPPLPKWVVPVLLAFAALIALRNFV